MEANRTLENASSSESAWFYMAAVVTLIFGVISLVNVYDSYQSRNFKRLKMETKKKELKMETFR